MERRFATETELAIREAVACYGGKKLIVVTTHRRENFGRPIGQHLPSSMLAGRSVRC